MIVQISLVRNELILIKKLLPIWKKYSDGFIFMLDENTDETEQYLKSVQKEYNILEVLKNTRREDEVTIETDLRQSLFDAALKYSDKIICLDADEYIDGTGTKQDLENILINNPDTRFHLQWNQYTSCNTLRIDGPWKHNFKDRIGCYKNRFEYYKSQNHSHHLPSTGKDIVIDSSNLFVSHLQWLDKKYVAIKQYYWKVYDYVNKIKYRIDTVGNQAYDSSVNNFEWEEEYTYFPLQISPHVFEKDLIDENYRLEYIKQNVEKYNIPNLGDWGFDIANLKSEKSNPYKVSIITAIGSVDIYGKYIDRYIKSVTDQHMFLETEHVVVYSEWCDDFDKLKKFANFKFIKENEKLGVYNAWNIGIQNSTTEYVTNWNIDDIRHPINTKIKYDLLTKNNYDVAYNYYTATDNENIDFYNIENTVHLNYPDNYENYVLQDCYVGPDPMWKKSLHELVGYFDYDNFNTIGDWEMWIRFALIAKAKFKLIPEVLCIYLDHKNTVSQRQSNKVQQEKQKLYIKYEKFR
jgi:hypothetical protein